MLHLAESSVVCNECDEQSENHCSHQAASWELVKITSQGVHSLHEDSAKEKLMIERFSKSGLGIPANGFSTIPRRDPKLEDRKKT